MASKTVVYLEDDLDGSEAAETVTFTIQGVEYELDLSKKNLTEFLKTVEPYVEAARRVGGRKRSGSAAKASGGADTQAVRAWAVSNGYDVSSRGRIAANVVEAYRAAVN
jgi:hypothetical protein